MTEGGGFEDLAWLLTSNNLNRGILRQNFNEAALLWRAVQSSSGPILEIGRRHGGSTVLLLSASGDRSVTSIDTSPAHHPDCDRVFQHIGATSPGRLALLVDDSRKPRPGAEWGLMFVDGDHSYEGVKADVAAHWSELKRFDGATAPSVVFHDAVPNDGLSYDSKLNHHEGVRLVCDQLMSAGCAEKVASAGSSLWLRKIAELPERF